MIRSLAPLAACLALSACMQVSDDDRRDDSQFCSDPRSAICAFINDPLRLAQNVVRLPRRPYPFKPLAAELNFVDATGQLWVAPEGTLTDGASIPPAFVAVVGRPTSAPFAKAAAVHDSYCGVGNEGTTYFHTRPWRDTHRMFYEALRVGGTPERRAKTMYAAVYMGGPRWPFTRPDPLAGREVLSTRLARGRIDNPQLGHVPEEALQQALSDIVDVIAATNPSLPGIEALVDAALAEVLAQFPATPGADASGPAEPADEGRARDPVGDAGDPVSDAPTTGSEEASEEAAQGLVEAELSIGNAL
ncbi:hypothetical protein OB2597_06395 [Pseudooceanicola batsensis HTCC2597]|uniref:DUF1353 domain-containing protein n=1 Tax=Pseudooceanicola batsensis (strain ATCC BAA-863 / DSM 15984 / KCTC 12145 / HTCC2597) TaxID=252305 RepID=A3TTB4_PSEBH|nr:DUF1353 domain-containing protein [Pseudooceanicola batsensis]EAQ04891.1 hypothetical protein OB2597_06395 [Pseudooceanicola batsensis HTCC2597]